MDSDEKRDNRLAVSGFSVKYFTHGRHMYNKSFSITLLFKIYFISVLTFNILGILKKLCKNVNSCGRV